MFTCRNLRANEYLSGLSDTQSQGNKSKLGLKIWRSHVVDLHYSASVKATELLLLVKRAEAVAVFGFPVPARAIRGETGKSEKRQPLQHAQRGGSRARGSRGARPRCAVASCNMRGSQLAGRPAGWLAGWLAS